MANHRVRLVGSRPVAEGTLAFEVEKPPNFGFKPGQSVDVSLVDPSERDDQGTVRTFSIASAPSEPLLQFATRLRDTAFKRVLRNLPAGAPIDIEGPMGSFTLHRNPARPAVFLAGGIGITPFMSILREATRCRDARSLHLFYSNRRPEDAAFLAEIEDLQRGNQNLSVVATMAEMDKSQQTWDGERGFIDADMLARHLPALNGPIYYIAGPPGMVAAMRDMLVKAGIDEDDIRTEDFAGY